MNILEEIVLDPEVDLFERSDEDNQSYDQLDV